METDTLENILNSWGIDRVDILGLDCEMSEVNVLKSAGKWLSEKRIRNVGLEAHGEALAKECKKILEKADYEIVGTEANGAIIYARAR